MHLLHEGDELAFNEIFNRYFDKLISIAYNLLRDKQSSEEIVQEVLIRLWDRRYEVRVNSLNAYLAMSVKYSVLTSLSRQKRHENIIHTLKVNDSSEETNELIYARFLQQYIDGLAGQLPDKCRTVFRYSRYEERTIPEIAALMDISQKTVEAHLTKALKFIRLSLKRYELPAILATLADHFFRS